ncbi:MAG: sigma-70 family RNA polymerase sigma factor [Pseudomonadota bacterium]|nr:sigma-70 family RNA polymerase sigma factor [Pseudomonadota bacterium]MDP1903786.1 sigma-70 family RNA polymerase sigma factor [Pseudomonadota bacterium]MDP2353727.1 sigma-70 family RNA polymerase sigma factor [Pseudomonadota bacterium]
MNINVLDSPDAWLDEHGAALYKYALLHTRDEHKAEEAVQETLLAALQARDRFSGGASARTWLIGILKHKIMDMFRHDARVVQLEDPDDLEDLDVDTHPHATDAMFASDGHWQNRLSDWGNPEELLERGQFMAILQRCLDVLPPRLARLFMLREVMEENSETICQELAITPTNLWTMLYRARLGLRQCLDRNWVGHAVTAARR